MGPDKITNHGDSDISPRDEFDIGVCPGAVKHEWDEPRFTGSKCFVEDIR